MTRLCMPLLLALGPAAVADTSPVSKELLFSGGASTCLGRSGGLFAEWPCDQNISRDSFFVSADSMDEGADQERELDPPSRFDLWTLVDLALALTNGFHLLCAAVFTTPSNSPLKAVALKAGEPFLKRVHPLIENTCLLCFLGLAWVAHRRDMPTRCVITVYTAVSAFVFMRLGDILRKVGSERIMDIEREVEAYDILAFKPPSLRLVNALLAPYNAALPSEAFGLENVPTDRPCFYVTNHSLLGLEMVPFFHRLYREKGIFLRGLAHHTHFGSPQGPLIRKLGAVDGTRRNVDTLMRAGENILVYPGSADELFKHSSVERYSLVWKERLGFARMAIKHGYPIMPCAAVGVEDMLQPVADVPVPGGFMGIKTLPVVVPAPGRVQKLYFWFGEPIDTTRFGGEDGNDEFARELRDEVKAAVEAGIREMRAKQEADPERFLTSRVANRARSTSDALFRGSRAFLPKALQPTRRC